MNLSASGGIERSYAENAAERSRAERSDGKQSVTPAFLRSLMGYYPDEADTLFQKHKQQLYHLMEIETRKKQLQVTYSVIEDSVIDEGVLRSVLLRLVGWLRKKRFYVEASSQSARSFIVSWDPKVTPDSITPEERANPESVAMKRLKSLKRKAEYESSVANLLPSSLSGLASSGASALLGTNSARDQNAIAELLSFSSSAPAPSSAIPQRRLSRYSLEQDGSVAYPEHLLARTRHVALRAASVAGVKGGGRKERSTTTSSCDSEVDGECEE